MQAVVLVGGQGTRLRPLTADIPKPVVPLVDRPFISYLIEWLDGHGVDEVVLACGFLPDALRDVLGEGEPGGPRLTWVVEPEPRGTAGAIKHAEPHLRDRFLALNGDVLSDLDLTSLIRFHEESGALATLGLHPVEEPGSYGLVRRELGGEVTEFVEKPDERSSVATGEVNAGTYVLEREVLDRVPPGRSVSIERELFPRMAGSGLYGLRLEGYWMDIGTPDRYLQATWDILEGRVRTRVEPHPDAVLVAPGAEVDPGATVGPRAVVSAGSKVADGAEITGSVLLDGCRVGQGATVRGSILSPGVLVAPGAEVAGATVGSDERVAA